MPLCNVNMDRRQDRFLLLVQLRCIAQRKGPKVSRLLNQDMSANLRIVRRYSWILKNVEVLTPKQADELSSR